MDVYVHESRRPAAGARGAIAMLADARVEATVPTVDLDRAREFYEARLGLRPAGTRWATPGAIAPGREVLYECGAATRLLLYERPSAGHTEHTLAHFTVADVEAAVDELRGRGVTFEEATVAFRANRFSRFHVPKTTKTLLWWVGCLLAPVKPYSAASLPASAGTSAFTPSSRTRASAQGEAPEVRGGRQSTGACVELPTNLTSCSLVRKSRNDGLRWPRRDGLKWPRFASVVVSVDLA